MQEITYMNGFKIISNLPDYPPEKREREIEDNAENRSNFNEYKSASKIFIELHFYNKIIKMLKDKSIM